MSDVNVRTLKDKLSEYLYRVERGEHVVVLRHGKPVARLIPLQADGAQTLDNICEGLARRGLMILPQVEGPMVFPDPPIATRTTKQVAQMVIEDRR